MIGALYGASIAEATIVIGLRVDNELWFAADSKVVAESSEGTTPAPNTCKISEVAEGVFLANAGTLGAKDHFWVSSLVRTAFSRTGTKPKTVAEGVSRSEASIIEKLEASLRANVRKAEPKGILAGIVVFGFEGDSAEPFIHVRDFDVKDDAVTVGALKMLDCPPHENCMDKTIVMGDAGDVVEEYLNSHRGYLQPPPRDPAVLLQRLESLILLAVLKHPDICGPPVVVLRLTREGPDWKRGDAQCGKRSQATKTPTPAHSPRTARRR